VGNTGQPTRSPLGGKYEIASGLYPYIGELADSFTVQSIEFLDPGHRVYAPRDSFVYPGGVEEMGPADPRPGARRGAGHRGSQGTARGVTASG
jgi:hypothetical protein